MKSKNSARIIVVLVILLLSVMYTLPSTPLWESAFGSLSADEQTAMPIKLFEYKDEGNGYVLLTVTVDRMADIFSRGKNPVTTNEMLDKLTDGLRKKISDMGYEARATEADYENKKASIRVKIENSERLKTVIAESKLYAKLPLIIASVFPKNKITLGLDLKGGIDLVYQIDTDSIDTTDNKDSIDDALRRSVEIIRNRIDMYGIAEPSIKVQDRNRIRIQLPGVKDSDRVKELIQNTAMLQFHIVIDQAPSAEQLGPIGENETVLMSPAKDGHAGLWYKLVKKPEITGRDLKFAKVAFDEMSNPMVHIEFNSEGSVKFAQCTGAHVGEQLAIVLDGKVRSAPNIQQRINGGSAQITGRFTFEEAQDLSVVLRAGALPASLIALESRVVGPTLGQQSIKAGFIAGIIGFALVMFYMAFYYKACGIVADLAVIFNSLIVFACLVFFGGTMTMPGIAGFILSVGMAVDANVIIFERIREEYHSGKTVRASIAAGFDRALSCIVDSNVTTLLVVAILYNFASGPIRGFATTLGIGLVANVYTAVVFTQLCLEAWFNGNTKRALSI